MSSEILIKRPLASEGKGENVVTDTPVPPSLTLKRLTSDKDVKSPQTGHCEEWSDEAFS